MERAEHFGEPEQPRLKRRVHRPGWADEAGRKSGAMRLVLWRAVLALKARGVAWLDLGGINPENAPGVTEFKLGTGGQAVETAGLYR